MSQALARKFKLHINRRISHLLIRIIVHRHFRLRHWRCKLRIIHQDLPPLINLPRLVQRLKRPPNRLHKVLVHRPIRPLKIHPTPNPINRPLPRLRVRHHAFLRFQDVIF